MSQGKFTPARIKNILAALKKGASRRAASRVSDVDHSTVVAWMKRGRLANEASESTGEPIPEADAHYAAFYDDVLRIEAGVEAQLLKVWLDQTPSDWRAAQAMLACRWPEQYAKNRESVTAEVTNPDTGGAKIVVTFGAKPTPEDE